MKLHSFPFYVDDWRGSDTVAGLTLAEEGLYLRLICAQWRDPHRSLSSALPDLARIARVSLEEFQQHWPQIAHCFARIEGGRIVNRKLRDVYRAAAKFTIEKRAKAKVAAKRRWGQQLPLRAVDARALPEHANLTVPVPNHKKIARGRARGACPHDPACPTTWLCGRRVQLDADVTAGLITPAERDRLVTSWLQALDGTGLPAVTEDRQ